MIVRPSTPGSSRSTIMTSGDVERAFSKPAIPVAARSTWKPRSTSSARISSAVSSSSSISSTLDIASVASAPLWPMPQSCVILTGMTRNMSPISRGAQRSATDPDRDIGQCTQAPVGAGDEQPLGELGERRVGTQREGQHETFEDGGGRRGWASWASPPEAAFDPPRHVSRNGSVRLNSLLVRTADQRRCGGPGVNSEFNRRGRVVDRYQPGSEATAPSERDVQPPLKETSS